MTKILYSLAPFTVMGVVGNFGLAFYAFPDEKILLGIAIAGKVLSLYGAYGLWLKREHIESLKMKFWM